MITFNQIQKINDIVVYILFTQSLVRLCIDFYNKVEPSNTQISCLLIYFMTVVLIGFRYVRKRINSIQSL